MLGRDDVPLRLAVAFAAFCLLASATYLLNDVRDRDRDRLHPVKRRRPVASGELPAGWALAAAAAATAAGLGLLAAVGWAALAAGAGYLGLTGAYSLGLKRVPVVEAVIVAAGFVVRAVAGGAAAGVGISGWFLAVVSFASLSVVVAKRYAEHRTLGDDRGATRPALAAYPAGALRAAALACAAGAVGAYWLWAAAHPDRYAGVPWSLLSALPLSAAIGRYARLAGAGRAEAPEELTFADRPLQLAGLAWAVLFAIGVYLGG